MSLFSAFKRNAQLALRGSWGRAILILLITAGAGSLLWLLQALVMEILVDHSALDPTLAILYGFNEYFFDSFVRTSLLESAIILVFAVADILLFAPLSLGVTRWYYGLVRGTAAPLTELFRFFETGRAYKRALWLRVNLSVRVMLWAILFFIVPGGIMGGSLFIVSLGGGVVTREMAAMASVGMLFAAALTLLCLVLFFAVINRYMLASYLLCEDEQLTVSEALRLSVAYTKGYRFSLVWFALSFFGWFLLTAFLFPLLYVAPYFNTATAMYARYIIEKNRFVPADPTREFVMEQQPAKSPVAPEAVWEQPPGDSTGAPVELGIDFGQEPTHIEEESRPDQAVDSFHFPTPGISPVAESGNEAPPAQPEDNQNLYEE